MANDRANSTLAELVKNKVDRKEKQTEKKNKAKAIITSFEFIH